MGTDIQCGFNSNIIAFPDGRIQWGDQDFFAFAVYGNPDHPLNQFDKNEAGIGQPLPCYEGDKKVYVTETFLNRMLFADHFLHVLTDGKYSLGLYEGYRPLPAVIEMDRRCDAGFVDLPGGGVCKTYVTNANRSSDPTHVPKTYRKSGHTTGNTGDLGIIENESGKSIHSIPFDHLGPKAGFVIPAGMKDKIDEVRENDFLFDVGLQDWFADLDDKAQLHFLMFASGMHTYYDKKNNPVEYWHFTITDPEVTYDSSKIRLSSDDLPDDPVVEEDVVETETTSAKLESALEKLAEAIAVLKEGTPNQWMKNSFVMLALTSSETYLTSKGLKSGASAGKLDKYVLYHLVKNMGDERARYRKVFFGYIDRIYSRSGERRTQAPMYKSDDLKLESGKVTTHAVKFYADAGTPVYSGVSGVVLLADSGWEKAGVSDPGELSTSSQLGGNVVVIYDPFRKQIHRFAHMGRVSVKPGQAVKVGQEIGSVGNSGLPAVKGIAQPQVLLEVRELNDDGEFVNLDHSTIRSLLFLSDLED